MSIAWSHESDAASAGRLTAGEIETVSRLLGRLEPGFLPFPIFLAVTRLVTTPTMNVIGLRSRTGRTEVLLARRPADDNYWPDQWHPTGTVIRATDAPDIALPTAYERIMRKELGGRSRGRRGVRRGTRTVRCVDVQGVI